MTTKLVASPDEVGIDPAEIAAEPGVVTEVKDDVLRDLMSANVPMPVPHDHRAHEPHGRHRMYV